MLLALKERRKDSQLDPTEGSQEDVIAPPPPVPAHLPGKLKCRELPPPFTMEMIDSKQLIHGLVLILHLAGRNL